MPEVSTNILTRIINSTTYTSAHSDSFLKFGLKDTTKNFCRIIIAVHCQLSPNQIIHVVQQTLEKMFWKPIRKG